MNLLIIVNYGPYGTEHAYNALRIATQVLKDYKDEATVNIFLMGDAVQNALPGQQTPEGYYNIERMLKVAVSRGAKIKTCGTCEDARGIQHIEKLKGVERGTMPELSQWVAESDKVINY